MGAAYGVASHILEHGELTADSRAVDYGAECAGVVVEAHAVELHVIAVEEETFVGVKTECAETGAGDVGIELPAFAVEEFGCDGIERR